MSQPIDWASIMSSAAVRTIAAAAALALSGAAHGQIRVLTPSDDSCRGLIAAMDSADRPKLLAAGGWAIGFWSGVAQGAGIDFLRNASTDALMRRLYVACREQPARPLSLAVENLARTLIAEYKVR
jgi:hypothetical protein